MKKILIVVLFSSSAVLISLFVPTNGSFAYVSSGQSVNANLPPSPSLNPLDYLKNLPSLGGVTTQGIGTSVPSLPSFSRFLDTGNLSAGDVVSMLKAVAVLTINLFLIVIQTVAGILKALLPFLSR